MTTVSGFDWQFYLEYNKDVLDQFGDKEYSAVLHYNTHGCAENRIYSEQMLYSSYPFMLHFDWEYYRNNNSDLKDLLKYQLIDHYIYQGSKEKRDIFFSNSLFNFLIIKEKSMPAYNDKISVIIPVFNRHDLLKASIESIINQTHANLEVIIVDDGSDDYTKNVIKQFIKDPRVTVLTNATNYGCYPSINLGLNMCSGDYITVHGSDDVSIPTRLQTMIHEAKTDNKLMIGNYILRTHYESFDNVNIESFYNIFIDTTSANLINANHCYECCKPLVSLGTLMYHSSVFDKIGSYENIRKGGDMILFEKFLKEYENIVFTDLDCSHRYLTKYNQGTHYSIIGEILYLSPEMNKQNITNQDDSFDINYYRQQLRN